MEVKCPNCPKILIIPDERIPRGKEIAFPCPDCKELIRLNFKVNPVHKASPPVEKKPENFLTGRALKEKILGTVQDLPPMPQSVIKAREIMADPKRGFKELATLFEADQALAARILKMANSSYYGMRGKISSIQKASVVLGQNAIGELITLGGASSLLGNRLEGYGLDAGDLWKHSLAVAFGSRVIADKIKPALSGDAFTAGLLHDSGKLILDHYIQERWDLFEKCMSDGQHTFLDAEKEVLELDHPEIASEVCAAWHIPPHLAVAIRCHHRPSLSQKSELAYMVHVADATALMTGIGIGVDGTQYRMEEGTMEFLGLKEEDLNDVMAGVLEASRRFTEE